MLRLLTIIVSTLLIFTACDSATEKPDVTTPDNNQTVAPRSAAVTTEKPASFVQQPVTGPHDLMNQPAHLQRFEIIAEAMTVWRQYADQKPTLLLLTGSPALTPTPVELLEKVDSLAINGTIEEIRLRSNKSSAAPLLRTSMAVDIALRNRWFSNLNWIVPMRDQSMVPDQETMRTQFIERRMFSEAESNSLILNGHTVSGAVRNTPFSANNISQLTKSKRPVLVHIDLSYFQSLYKNEIATPILQTIYQTLSTIKELHLQTVDVTFAYNHIDGQVALDVRFVGEVLSTLLAQPELLNQPVPANWQRQADAIYLRNFFQSERIDVLHKAQEKSEPGSAWVKFSLYRAAAEQKQGVQALAYLAEAVTLDPIYAYEYGNLAQLAYEKKRPDEAMRMFSLAAKIFPDDPFIKLRMAELAAGMGEERSAMHLIEQLEALNWSTVYYPRMPEFLKDFRAKLKEDN